MISRGVAEQLVAELARQPEQGAAFRQAVVGRLSELSGYNWSGIYRLEGDTLVLDAFVGAETEHTRIPVGVGVCGTAVKEGRSQVIEDVRTLDNYLACSISTRSEIVVLIRGDGQVLGQIDIDGHEVGAFDASDEQFLQRVAELIADRW